MHIDKTLCVKCKQCAAYCPMGCIGVDENGEVFIDGDECVECDRCRNVGVCKRGALMADELQWPRTLRGQFSNPLVTHPKTGVPGRGTEEMKTNDVTGRYKRGRAGIAIELGRPGTGARFYDVQKVAMAVAPYIIAFESHNPVTALMTDVKTGKIDDAVMNEKVLSAIVECDVENKHTADVLNALRAVEGELNTVCSVDLACRLEADGSCTQAELAREAGFWLSPNGKTCVGLGRPLAKEG